MFFFDSFVWCSLSVVSVVILCGCLHCLLRTSLVVTWLIPLHIPFGLSLVVSKCVDLRFALQWSTSYLEMTVFFGLKEDLFLIMLVSFVIAEWPWPSTCCSSKFFSVVKHNNVNAF